MANAALRPMKRSHWLAGQTSARLSTTAIAVAG